MVANLTIGKKGYENVTKEAMELAPIGQDIKQKALEVIDNDTDAFFTMMDAMRLPKKTEEEIEFRKNQIEKCTQAAINAPLETMRLAMSAAELALKIVKIGNTNALSDAGVAALTANCASQAAYYNILINFPGITDENYKQKTLNEAKDLLEKNKKIADSVKTEVLAKLND